MPSSTIAVIFEGVGSDPAVAGGVAFYHDPFDRPNSLLAGYEWWPALAALPSPVSASVNPFTGDWSVSSQTFTFNASDRVVGLFMADQVNATYTLQNTLTTTSTAITVDISGIVDGQVIRLKDEAIRVGTASGTSLTGCTRGYWGTTAQPHRPDEGVYAGLPYWRSRLAKIVEIDVDAGTQTTRWRGLVSDISMDGPNVVVRCEEVLSVLAGAEVNRRGTQLSPGNSSWVGNRLRVVLGAIRLQSLSNAALDIAASRSVLFQADDALVPLSYRRVKAGSTVGWLNAQVDPFGLSGESLLLLGSTSPDGDATGAVSARPVETLHELVGWIRQSGIGAGAQGYTPISGSALLPFHPISVALTLLTSTGNGTNGDYDILGESWALGVDYLDWSVWETARDAHPDLVIDRLILGWNGEGVNVFDVVREVLRPFGFYLGVTDDGLLYPARLRMVTEGDLDEAANTVSFYADGPLALDRGLASSAPEIRAAVGRLPWQDATFVTVRDPSRSSRAGQVLDQRVHTLDLSVFAPERVSDEAVSPFVGLLGLGLDEAPTLRGRCPDFAKTAALDNLDLGAFIRVADLGGLENPWIVQPDGTRTTLGSTSPRWVGILTERAWDPKDHSYTIGILLINWRAGRAVKRRAPAAIVASTPGAEVVTLATTGPYGTAPGQGFAVGDEVITTDPNGTDLGASVRAVTAVAASSITLNSDFSPQPDAGDVIRLANSGAFSNDQVYDFTFRPYVYLSPDSSVGPSDAEGDQDQPDIYGTSLFGGTGATPPTDAPFVPIDQAAIVTPNEAACRPLDSWLEYTLRDNISVLYRLGHQITWTPRTANAGTYTANAGHRPYCSTDYTTVLFVPWICSAGLSGITLGMVQRVSSESDESGDVTAAFVDMRLVLDDRSTDFQLTSTDGDTPEFQPATVELDFTARPFGTAQIHNLELWIRSYPSVDGADVTRSDATFGSTTVSSTSGTLYTDTSSTRPNADALDLQCTEDAEGALYDHLKSLSASKMAVLGAGSSGDPDISTRWLSYAQIRSIEVQEKFADIGYPADSSMRPGIPVDAETCITHLTRERRHQLRPRPVWIGPTGDRPYDSETPAFWPEDYTRRHIVHNADDSVNVSAKVFDASVWLDTENPTLTILLNVIPTRIPDLTNFVRSDIGKPGSEAVTSAIWDLWAEVQQLEDLDTSWASAADLGDTLANVTPVRLLHWACSADTEYPKLFDHALSRVQDAWTYREGQIWRADRDLVQTIALQVPVTYDPTTNRPARVTVSAEAGAVDWVFGDSDSRAVEFLDLIVVGASIWETPL